MKLSVFSVVMISMMMFAGYSLNGQHRDAQTADLFITKSKDSSRLIVYVNDQAFFGEWLHNNLSHVELSRHQEHSKIFLLSNLKPGDAFEIQKAPSVRSYSIVRRAKPEREVGGIDQSLNGVTAIHSLYPELDGSDLIVSIKENPFDKHDMDFKNRVFQPSVVPVSSDIHATTMATIVAGAGNSSPDGRGVAKNAMIAFSDFENLTPESTDQLRADGITVQNHSYGVGIENFYGIETHLYDKQAYEYDELVHVFSSGNNGDEASAIGTYAGIAGFANLTGQFKMSKNTLSIGSTNALGDVAPLSSRGPAYDGRIKPEVVAHGDQGTSEAAAIVSGITLLVQQAYRNITGSIPPSSLVRAALVNSADDRGRMQVDYEYGFGTADATGAIQTVLDGRYFNAEVEGEETKVFQINIPSSSRELKVTLAWTDKEAEPDAQKALINDLDIEVYHASSNTTYAPWSLSVFPHADSLKKNAVRRSDHLNTIEQITISDAPPGDYEIRVKALGVPTPQRFSVAYELVEDFRWTFPMKNDVLVSAETKLLRWKWNDAAMPASLQWHIQGETAWQTIGDVDMAAEYFMWTVPSINDVIQLKLSWATGEFVTDAIRISNVLLPSIGYYCSDDGIVFWNKDESDSYNVYILGDKFLELTRNSDDTLYYHSGETPPFISVSSVIKGKEGPRSRLVNLQTGLCYIISFLPERAVTDSVSLLLILGTDIGVKSFDLERITSSGSTVIQSIDPISGTQFRLHDRSPLDGSNHYQIRLVRENGEEVVSHVEEVYFVREDDLRFFPNPVTAGESLNVLVDAEGSEFWIQDMLGRNVKASYEDGELKTLDTSGLTPGVYIVKSVTPSGRVLSGRIVVK